MKPAWLERLPPKWRAHAVRIGFNLHPAFRGAGGRVIEVSHDLRRMRVRLPYSWRTRNVVGSLYGGSLFAITDGAHPMMLMAALGDEVVVWDKVATIRYRRPGYSAVEAEFELPPQEIEAIRAALREAPEIERSYTVELRDQSGEVCAVVDRIVYIGLKKHYRQKGGGACEIPKG